MGLTFGPTETHVVPRWNPPRWNPRWKQGLFRGFKRKNNPGEKRGEKGIPVENWFISHSPGKEYSRGWGGAHTRWPWYDSVNRSCFNLPKNGNDVSSVTVRTSVIYIFEISYLEKPRGQMEHRVSAGQIQKASVRAQKLPGGDRKVPEMLKTYWNRVFKRGQEGVKRCA